MNQYITNNQPNENLTYVLDYLGLSVEEFLKMTDQQVIAIVKKFADALNDGVMTKSTSGKKNPNGMINGVNKNSEIYGEWNAQPDKISGHNDSGSKSRYFDLDVWAEKHGLLQFPKASKRERNEGCERLEEKNNMRVNAPRDNEEEKTATKMGNFHPTVKPVHLMSWLVRLVSKEGDTVLDPFAGSFTTGVACKMLGRNFIGIEMDKSYVEIGKARINACEKKTKQMSIC